ncbi:hypothetical protein ACWIG4_30395 [Streptomyces sp. NPDC002248]
MPIEFWVDHSDPPYPQIRHISDPGFDPRFHDAVSLTKARAEIKLTCRDYRQHWLAVQNTQIARTREQIIRGD